MENVLAEMGATLQRTAGTLTIEVRVWLGTRRLKGRQVHTSTFTHPHVTPTTPIIHVQGDVEIYDEEGEFGEEGEGGDPLEEGDEDVRVCVCVCWCWCWYLSILAWLSMAYTHAHTNPLT